MSSKRKEKKIKGTDTVPLPPPTEMANFSYTPQKFPKIKGAVTVNPLGNDFQTPPPPTENLVHSGAEMEVDI